MPLELAQDQLRHQLKQLKQQLYELINADYPQFMELAVGLQGRYVVWCVSCVVCRVSYDVCRVYALRS